MKKKVVGIIQARQGSSRLPGKTLTPIWGNKTTLEVMLERVLLSKTLDNVIVATTTLSQDQEIVDLCKTLGVDVYSGSPDNVLDRYYQAACIAQATHIVRLTADCPLHDYEVIDHLVRTFFENSIDYAGNALDPTYPDGFDAEIFTFAALNKSKELAVLDTDKEHVTPYIHRNFTKFRILNVPYSANKSYLRLTLDTPQDLQVIRTVISELFSDDRYVHLDEIVSFLDQMPDLTKINASIIRNEGYLNSLKKDGEQIFNV